MIPVILVGNPKDGLWYVLVRVYSGLKVQGPASEVQGLGRRLRLPKHALGGRGGGGGGGGRGAWGVLTRDGTEYGRPEV